MKNFMMSMGANKIVETCVKVQPGEEVLIVTEVEKFPIAETIAEMQIPVLIKELSAPQTLEIA